jgi:hypothetical protein
MWAMNIHRVRQVELAQPNEDAALLQIIFHEDILNIH